MQVTLQDVEKIAVLAKLRLDEAEKIKYREQLEQILTYVQKLNELGAKVLDVDMPGKSGVEVLREIRKERPDILAIIN